MAQQQQPPCTRLREQLQQLQHPDNNSCISNSCDSGSSNNRSVSKCSKPLVRNLHDVIVCRLCFGYIIDATTIIECLHTYCRSCIIYRLKNGPKTCPACDTLVMARPRPDMVLQQLIYLVVPGLYKSELERRRNFRLPIPNFQNPCSNQSPQGAPKLSFDDLVSLSLCPVNLPLATRYLKCPAGVTVRHLQRLLMLKRGWKNNKEIEAQYVSGNIKIEMMYEIKQGRKKTEFEILKPSWTLMDLALIFDWSREDPMRLYYRITLLDEATSEKQLSSANTSIHNEEGSVDVANHHSSMENIQRPPTPPPSPKPRDPLMEKSPRPVVAVAAVAPVVPVAAVPPTTVVPPPPPPPPPNTTTTPLLPSPQTATIEPFSSPKELGQREAKKTRWVSPVVRSPQPEPAQQQQLVESRSRSGKLHRLEHHKRKKRRNKRVIAEITRPPQEDVLKLKVRLTSCPSRLSSNSSQKDKLLQMRAVRKEKTKDEADEAAPLKHLRLAEPATVKAKLEEQEEPREGHEEPEEQLQQQKQEQEVGMVVVVKEKAEVQDVKKEEKKQRELEVTREDKAATGQLLKRPLIVAEKKLESRAGAELLVVEESKKLLNQAESPKNEEVLRRLGLVAVSEANRTKQDHGAESQQAAKNEEKDPAVEREKLEKQLQESKANRVRSLLAEKQMRDTLKSMMSKDTRHLLTGASNTSGSSISSSSSSNISSSSSSSSSSGSINAAVPSSFASLRCATPTAAGTKRKDPPPLTPLRSAKRPSVSFAPTTFTINNKYESPLDLSNQYKDNNALDLSSGISEELTIRKCSPDEKPVGILRIGSGSASNSSISSRQAVEKPREELAVRKTSQESNLHTLSDAAVSLLGASSASDNKPKPTQMVHSIGPFMAAPSSASKVALKIPQPYQRITGFGTKIKPNIGVRHIPNPQAVVASQYRNQRTEYFSLAHQPP